MTSKQVTPFQMFFVLNRNNDRTKHFEHLFVSCPYESRPIKYNQDRRKESLDRCDTNLIKRLRKCKFNR